MEAFEGLRNKSQQPDEMTDDREARNDFWSIEGTYIDPHNVELRFQLFLQKEESFAIQLRYIDVIRRTHSTLGALQGSRRKYYWNIEGDRNLSKQLTGFTHLYLWSITKNQATTRLDHLCQKFGPVCLKQLNERR